MIDFNTVYADLPTTIKSYVVTCPDSTFTIVLNTRMSAEQNCISYAHELGHIKNGDYDRNGSVGIIEMRAHST